jgi:hypothetical protein
VRTGGVAHHLEVLGWKCVHDDTAVFPIGNLRTNHWQVPAVNRRARRRLAFIVEPHLRYQLGVVALGLDDGGDALSLALRIPGHT